MVKRACYLVGDDASINVWLDLFVPWLDGYKSNPRGESISMDPLMESSLINTSIHVYIAGGKIGCWSFLILESVGAISEIQIPLRNVQGRLILTEDH